MDNGAVLELSREDILKRIEKAAQRRLKMSASELLRAYRAGHLEDPGRVGDLLVLADLLREDDPIFAR